MKTKYSTKVVITLCLVITLSISFLTIVGANTSPLTKDELDVTPMNRTGFIYNPYSVFVYYKGDSNDGVIRFNDTVRYFNTLNNSVSFSFNVRMFHENRSHIIPLPESIDRENYTFYSIPKTTKWMLLPDTLSVNSMYKGVVELNVEINEEEAYDVVKNGTGGLIGLVSATPSISQNIGGTMVTSVPSYKVFIVLLPEKDQDISEEKTHNDAPPWMLYIGIVIIILVVAIVLAKKLEFVEVEEEVVEK